MAELIVPADLTDYDQFVLWRYELRNQKKTKVPYRVDGRMASVTRPEDWTSFEAARAVWRQDLKKYNGLGFVFSKADPFVGIDLDDSLAAGQVKPWAQSIVGRFSDTYIEISPSLSGLKIWVRGALPENVPGVRTDDGSIEVYSHARYFTVTGRVFRGAPLQVEDHSADLTALYKHLRGDGGGKDWPLQPAPGGRIPFGRQHNTLVSIAGTLRARRVCDEAILACLLAVAQHQCEKPMDRAHIDRIVKSTRPWANR